jgi:hypothetical protein
MGGQRAVKFLFAWPAYIPVRRNKNQRQQYFREIRRRFINCSLSPSGRFKKVEVAYDDERPLVHHRDRQSTALFQLQNG